jgi:hypothetical protein
MDGELNTMPSFYPVIKILYHGMLHRQRFSKAEIAARSGTKNRFGRIHRFAPTNPPWNVLFFLSVFSVLSVVK